MTIHVDPIGRADGSRLHPETNEVLHREARRHVFTSDEGCAVVADIPGWYPDGGGEAVHTPDDEKAKVLAAAALKALERGFEPATHAASPGQAEPAGG